MESASVKTEATADPSPRCPICAGSQHRVSFDFPFLKLSRCLSCDVTFAWDRQNHDEVMVEDDWESDAKNVATYYDHQFEVKNPLYLRALREAGVKPGRLLDIGAAYGSFLQAARTDGWQVEGIEPSRYACEIAFERFGLRLKQGFFTDSSFPRASFDAVSAFDVVEHIESPMPFLAAAHAVLKEGGTLILSVPNYHSPTNLLSLWSYFATFGKVDIAAKLMTQVTYRSHHILYFTKRSIASCLRRAGFEPMSMTTLSTLFPEQLVERSHFESLGKPLRSSLSGAIKAVQGLEGAFKNRDTLLVIATRK